MRIVRWISFVLVFSFGVGAIAVPVYPRSLKVYLQHTAEGQALVRRLTGYEGTPGLIPDSVLVDFGHILNRLANRSARASESGEFLSLRERLIQLGKELDDQLDAARRRRPGVVLPGRSGPDSRAPEGDLGGGDGIVRIPTEPLGAETDDRRGILPGAPRGSVPAEGGTRVITSPVTAPIARTWVDVTDLTLEERQLIRARYLSSDIPSLLLESEVYIHIPKRAYEEARRQLEHELGGIGSELSDRRAGGRFVPGPRVAADGRLAEQMTFWRRLGERVKAYRSFFRSIRMTEGQWRSLARYYGRLRTGGESFSGADLVTLRKINARLDAISRYHEDELVMLAMSQQDPVIYTRLNALSAISTEQMVSGLLTSEEYLKVRKDLVERTRMNSIVVEAETRMLSTLDRIRFLAGSDVYADRGAGLIQTSEQNYETLIHNMRAAEGRKILLRAEIKEVRSALREARGEARTQLRSRLRSLNVQMNREEVLRSRYEGEASLIAEQIRKLYEEFVMQYERLETFTNLRVGRVGNTPVRAFELPDPMVPDAGEIESWSRVYDRALEHSMPKLMWDEVVLFLKTRVGNTRRVIEQIDALTQEVKRRWARVPAVFQRIEWGTRFTETELGQRFQKFHRGMLAKALAFLIKSGVITSVASVGTYAMLPESMQVEVTECARSFMADISPHLGIGPDVE